MKWLDSELKILEESAWTGFEIHCYKNITFVRVSVWMVSVLSTTVLSLSIKYVRNYLICKGGYLGIMGFCKNKLHAS